MSRLKKPEEYKPEETRQSFHEGKITIRKAICKEAIKLKEAIEL